MSNLMPNLKIIHLVFIIVLFGFVLFPFVTQAATVYFTSDSENIYQDDTFIVKLKIASPDEFINAVEGVLLFDKDKLEVKELSSGGSLFNLWLQPPIFSNQEGKISFVGGTPDGFQGEEALVLKIIFLAKNKGEAVLDFQDDTSAFLHDGKGTRISPWLRPLTFNVLERPPEITPKDEWQPLLEADKTPPEPFEINLGKNPSIFDNQYFISFFTTDVESGIDYYEVKEGQRDFVRAESPYLLKDQSLRSLIKVKAVDKAGNERITELIPSIPSVPFYKNILVWIVVDLIIILLIIYILWRIFGKRRKSKNEKS